MPCVKIQEKGHGWHYRKVNEEKDKKLKCSSPSKDQNRAVAGHFLVVSLGFVILERVCATSL